jgi:cytosine/adenosine deaminase-related metal-dependent hydrolase
MATRRTPIDPLVSPRRVLAGRVVTMDAAFTVIPDGRVFMENGVLTAVQPAEAPPPAGFESVRVTQTRGTIYPGLVDLHNHLPYNVLPLWQVPRKYGNRGQWASAAAYRTAVGAPMKVLGATPELLASICRYVEAKCLLGGTTTSQGITLANAAGIRRYFRGVVRNVEATDEAALPPASTRVPDVAARDAQAFLTRLKRQKTCYLLHLSEGLDATAHRAFEALQLTPGEWAITPSLCGIHAAALKAPDFETLAAHGGSMVWSPFSNLLLYGGTADVGAAKAAGVPIALGPDWAPTGSRNQLGELKVAWLWSEMHGLFSARDLIAMVTRDAARMLEWSGALGSLEAGKRADLMVVDGVQGDPYQQLIFATEADVRLVVINGVARVGMLSMMRAMGASAGERITVGGESRLADLAHPQADPLVQGLGIGAAHDKLVDALGQLPALARRAERPMPVSALARMGAAPEANAWHLALDELVDTGVDLRHHLAPAGAEGRPLQRALMRPVGAAAGPLPSAEVKKMPVDPLTVVDDPDYLDRIDAQPNLPQEIKDGLRAFW